MPVGYNPSVSLKHTRNIAQQPDQATGALILAAGRSSRMGTNKACLPVGRITAIERVVASLRRAGVGRIVVVTGHESATLAPVLRRLRVEQVHNAGYDAGMFSSVQTGVASLREAVEAFFVLPVDCPLVTARVLQLLMEYRDNEGKGIVYPVCCGRRGHPPLLSARYIEPLLAARTDDNLQTFLGCFADDAVEVDVCDLTVLMDMDTPEDYRAIARFAAALDAAMGRSGGMAGTEGEEAVPTMDEALFLLRAAGTPDNIVEHCRAVADVGHKLTDALKTASPTLDASLVHVGCLLHDLARLHPNHALVAERLLDNLGLTRLGRVVGQHMVIEPELVRGSGITETELVYLADKLVADDEVVGLDEREARAFRKMRPGPEAAERIRDRMSDARAIAGKVSAVLGRPFIEMLRDPGWPPGKEVGQRRSTGDLQVFLIRHAEPAGPDVKRFLGQADPVLSPAGQRHARCLADRLMVMTGGACFDLIFTSDLRRAVMTAEAIAQGCATEIRTGQWLREIDVGLWEGLSWEEAKRAYPDEHAARELDIVERPFPNGESFRDLEARVVPRFFELVETSLAAGHRRVAVVGHKSVNRVILAHVWGLPLEELFSIDQEYGAITVMRFPRTGFSRLSTGRHH